jgi:chromate transporter
MSKLWELYTSFFKIGISTFGGGYAMLPILEREAVDKKGWISVTEMMDYYAISQCTPGIIAINTSTYIGYKVASVLGGVSAALGMISPSILIILVLAGLIQRFSALPLVESAFSGIQIAVAVIILNAVVKMLKNSIVDKITVGIFIVTLIVLLLFDIPTIWVIIAAFIFSIWIGRKQ